MKLSKAFVICWVPIGQIYGHNKNRIIKSTNYRIEGRVAETQTH